ncbi:MAG: hypothetical protein ABI847_14830 [Anaerolineales bacterium]
MESPDAGNPAEPIDALGQAAARLGVEFDQPAAREWMLAVAAGAGQDAIVRDAATGIFAHRIALADFNPADLDYFRQLAQRVRVERRPDVETAIAIAGSSAQGRVQVFPGDADFFERVNIKAPSLAAARATLGELLRATALRALAEPNIVLVEVNYGVYPEAGQHGGAARAAGDSILWTPDEVLFGEINFTGADGRPRQVGWGDVSGGLGWSYLGWIVADPSAGRIALASNMLDVTWEAPDGSLTPLDGAVDAWFQEIYLEPESIPVFTKIAAHVDPNARQAYSDNMRSQVHHYTHTDPSYCKATKRLYNLFRITDQLEAAAYLRELFDEPGAGLYQADGLLEAARLAVAAGFGIDHATIAKQIDRVLQSVANALDGPDEAELLQSLAQLRDQMLAAKTPGVAWEVDLNHIQARCRVLVNDYFRERLFGLPQIADFVAGLAG